MLQPGVVLFDQLSDSAQQRAVEDFVKFYLKKYRTNSLEILTSFPIQYEVQQINHDIQQNRGFHPEQLREFLVKYDGDLFKRIISATHESFLESGVMTAGSYEKWYQAQYDAIKPGL